jgi:hypothetical protein
VHVAFGVFVALEGCEGVVGGDEGGFAAVGVLRVEYDLEMGRIVVSKGRKLK